MSNPLKHLSFDEWLAHVFDHPVNEGGRKWYWDPDAAWWDGSATDTVRFMTQAFENAAVVLQTYSDAQLNQGLWYLADNGCSNHMFALLDTGVAWAARQRCIRAIDSLFEQCFARRCTPHLSHLDEPGASELNLVCYMWWDIIPIIGQPNNPAQRELDQEILGVFESALRLDSVACRESALHGLGHWQPYYPRRVEQIIDRFLGKQNGLREELRAYAMNASRGCIL